ncbi:MAG: hypothetical protein NTY34_01590 [Candidatus Omnitrophica bacterium]|nr:hypothetical protein [Candidatus Omnitrophota bacterium]
MKRPNTAKIAGFCLIMMAVALAMMAVPAYSAAPAPDGPPPDVIPAGIGNSTIQRAREAAKRAFNTPNTVKPDTEITAFTNPLSNTSKPLKVSVTSSPLGDAFYNKKSTGMNSAYDKTHLKASLLKETIAINLDTLPALPALTANDKETPGTQEITFEPITNLSKENMEAIDSLKAVMKDLKGLEAFTESSKAKEVNDKMAQIADIINSDKENMRLLYENNEMGGMFKELSDKQKLLMLKYEKSTEPYYDVVRNILAKNITVIQVAGIIKQITEEEMKRMPRDEIDKILEKLRQAKDKSFAKEYILQQEAKYREKYINPNAKKLAREMANILDDFTKQISGAIK